MQQYTYERTWNLSCLLILANNKYRTSYCLVCVMSLLYWSNIIVNTRTYNEEGGRIPHVCPYSSILAQQSQFTPNVCMHNVQCVCIITYKNNWCKTLYVSSTVPALWPWCIRILEYLLVFPPLNISEFMSIFSELRIDISANNYIFIFFSLYSFLVSIEVKRAWKEFTKVYLVGGCWLRRELHVKGNVSKTHTFSLSIWCENSMNKWSQSQIWKIPEPQIFWLHCVAATNQIPTFWISSTSR